MIFSLGKGSSVVRHVEEPQIDGALAQISRHHHGHNRKQYGIKELAARGDPAVSEPQPPLPDMRFALALLTFAGLAGAAPATTKGLVTELTGVTTSVSFVRIP